MLPQKKIYDLDEAREKIQAYCAYQERSHREVEEKLRSYGLLEEASGMLLVELIQHNFLNEERFARAFVRGRFRIKQWGRNKIRQHLKHHRISEYALKKAFTEIDKEDYHQALETLAAKKWLATTLKDSFKRRGKVAQYLISRGFEPDLVWEVLKQDTFL
jgi:regulatory protein